MAKRKRNAAAADNVTEIHVVNGLRLQHIEPMTRNQSRFFESYERGDHIFCHGLPGTGKTFLALYHAIRDVVFRRLYDQVVVVRSAVATRDMGHMPGKLDEKASLYEMPYEQIVNDLTMHEDGYQVMKQRKFLQFATTSYLRGITLDNTIIIVDEASNCTMHELDSIITRLGRNSKIIFCGDFRQTDLTKDADKRGFLQFMEIMKRLPGVSFIEFEVEDIVRSEFVKSYILAKFGYQGAQAV